MRLRRIAPAAVVVNVAAVVAVVLASALGSDTTKLIAHPSCNAPTHLSGRPGRRRARYVLLPVICSARVVSTPSTPVKAIKSFYRAIAAKDPIFVCALSTPHFQAILRSDAAQALASQPSLTYSIGRPAIVVGPAPDSAT